MRYIDKVIKGEDAFAAFMDRFRPGWREVPRCENTWQIFDIHVERFYERGPQDDHYKEFFWLVMPSSTDKGFTDGQYSNRRDEVYEGIRTGHIAG